MNIVKSSMKDKCHYCKNEGIYLDYDEFGKAISLCLTHISKYMSS